MRAISLWQPWASAIACDSKRIETRGWATNYRGHLVIHAAKRKVASEMAYFELSSIWVGALSPIGGVSHLPFGALVAVCDLIDCRPSESFTVDEIDRTRRPFGDFTDDWRWAERDMGNFEPDRFGWVLTNIRMIEQIPYIGKQGFFNVPDDLIPPRRAVKFGGSNE